VGRIVPGLVGGADSLHQPGPVVGELVDDVARSFHHPHVLLRVVGVDDDLMRVPEQRVPLLPDFGGFWENVSLGVHHDDAMLPARVHTHRALPPLVSHLVRSKNVVRISVKWTRVSATAKCARQGHRRALRGVAERILPHWEGEPRPVLWH